ncbi:MAG: SHOCT domain-containing protein [Nitrospirota bacterium]
MSGRSSPGLSLGVLAVAWLAALGFCGCAGTVQTGPPETRIVCGQCEEGDRFVRLQTRQAREQGVRFAHPFRLSPEDWKPILASVQVQTLTTKFLFLPEKQPAVPAFTQDEIDYLSGTLSKAFAEAQPHEIVVFGLAHPGSPDVVEMTTGGWFVERTSLHLVLANYRCAVTMPGVRERLSRDPLSPNTGDTFDLPAGAHQTLVRESSLVGPSLNPTPSELAIDYKPLLLTLLAPRPRGAAPPATAADSPGREQRGPARLSIEESLALLQRLRDRGLVTDEEYRAKKKQLIEQF